MATFISKVADERPVSVEGRQITVDQTSPARSTLVDVLNVARPFIGAGINTFASNRAEEIVSASQRGLDETIAGEEVFDDPILQEVANTSRVQAAGVASGQISREAAEVHVASSVTKAIASQPILTRQIREAAGHLLGFDPKSRAVQAFFSAFDTEAQLSSAANRANKPTKRQLGIEEIQLGFGVTADTATEMFNQRSRNDFNKESILNDLATNNATGEQAFSTLNDIDTQEALPSIFGSMKALADSGEEVKASTWRQIIDTERNASWQAMLAQLNSSGRGPDTATTSRMRALHNSKYETLFEQVKDFDSTAVREENLDRIVSMQKTFAAEAFPTFTFLNNAFGERTGAATMDLIRSAQGNPARLQALLSSTPSLQPLVALLQTDPKQFNINLEQAVRTLKDPTTEFTQEQAPFLDLFLSQVATKAPPEERERIVESLFDKNLNNKATSLLASAGRASATEKEVRRMKQEWNTVKAVTPNTILRKIEEGNNTLTDRGARVEIAPDGKSLMLVKGKDPLTGQPFQATGHPAFSDLQKLNIFLRAGDRGFGQDLDIPDVETLAKQLQGTLSGTPAAVTPAVQTARDTGSAVGLPDGTYADADGNRITVRNGIIVGG